MIELAAVADPAAVPDAVAAVLGIIQQPGMTLTDSVASALEGRSRLLVFDNCEHVVDATADVIEAILARSDDREDPCHQSRRTASSRRKALVGAITGHSMTVSPRPRRRCSLSVPQMLRTLSFIESH